PKTTSGKVQRRACRSGWYAGELNAVYQWQRASMVGQNANPSLTCGSELEQRLAEIWQQVLGGERPVGIYDNFFDLGGHSFLLLQVCNKLQAYLGYEVPVLDLFNYPTIHALSAHLCERQEQQLPLQPVIGQIQKRKAALRKL